MWGLIVGIIAGIILTIVGAIGAYNFFEFNKSHSKEFKFEYNEDYETMQKNKEGAKALAQEFADSAKGHNGKMSEKSSEYVLTYETKDWGKIAVISLGVLAAGGIVAGLFVIFASITTLGQNEVALLRNKITGEVTVMNNPGTTLQNPLTEKLTMSLTQVEKQFGNEDKGKGTDDYFPINAGGGQKIHIAANVKWKAADKTTTSTSTIRTLYKQTGSTAIDSQTVISMIKKEVSQASQNYVTTGGKQMSEDEIIALQDAGKASVTVPNLMGQQEKLRIYVERALTKMLLDKYDIELVQFTVTDMVPEEMAQKAIDQVTAASTKTQVQEAEAKAEQARGSVIDAQTANAVKELAFKEQDALNDFLSDKMILTALVSNGVILKNVNTIDLLQEAIQAASKGGKQIDLTDIIRQSKYYEKWDGKLPSTIAGDKDLLSIMVPSSSK